MSVYLLMTANSCKSWVFLDSTASVLVMQLTQLVGNSNYTVTIATLYGEISGWTLSSTVGETAWQIPRVQTVCWCNIMAIAISHKQWIIGLVHVISPVVRFYYWSEEKLSCRAPTPAWRAITTEMEWALQCFSAWHNCILNSWGHFSYGLGMRLTLFNSWSCWSVYWYAAFV